jgi:hypothetical protein
MPTLLFYVVFFFMRGILVGLGLFNERNNRKMLHRRQEDSREEPREERDHHKWPELRHENLVAGKAVGVARIVSSAVHN